MLDEVMHSAPPVLFHVICPTSLFPAEYTESAKSVASDWRLDSISQKNIATRVVLNIHRDSLLSLSKQVIH